MKISEVTTEYLLSFLNLDAEDYQSDVLEAAQDAAKEYIKKYTSLTDEEINESEGLIWAYQLLVQDFYDVRTKNTYKRDPHFYDTVDMILSMYAKNNVG